LSEAPKHPFSRLHGPLACILLAGYALCCLFVWVEQSWRPDWDGGIYLLTARSLALGEGYRYLGFDFSLRPPGLSWMLGPLIEADSYDFPAINRLLMGWAAGTVVAVYLMLRRAVGAWPALFVALLTGSSTLFVRNFNWVLSEFPCAALLFASIALLHEAGRRERGWWLWAVAGALCLAGAAWVRTVALLLLPGLLLLGWRKDRGWQRLRALLPVLLVCALVAPWLAWSRQTAARAVIPPDQLKLHDYSTAMWHEDPGDPDSPLVSWEGWLERISHNGSSLARKLAVTLLHWPSAGAGLVLLLLLLLGWLVRLRRSPSLLEWFAAAYTALILTYFAYNERLLLPLVPFVYLYLVELFRFVAERLSERASRPQRVALLPALPVAALLLLNASNLPTSLAAGEWQHQGVPHAQRWADLETVAGWLRENTPPDAKVLCVRAPSLAVLSGRRTYTMAFPRGRDLVRRYRPDYVVYEAGRGPQPQHEELEARGPWSWTLVGAGTGRDIRVYQLRRRARSDR
jgi:4-amino-4-deoxy-L-arabinose transferase-like glycosyltransferase